MPSTSQVLPSQAAGRPSASRKSKKKHTAKLPEAAEEDEAKDDSDDTLLGNETECTGFGLVRLIKMYYLILLPCFTFIAAFKLDFKGKCLGKHHCTIS